VKLVISADALRDRHRHFDYVFERNPNAARRMDAAIPRDLAYIARQPYSGRRATGETRESVVSRTPYVVSYELREREIHVLRIWHHAQDRPMPD